MPKIKYSQNRKDKIKKELKEYLETHDIPIIAEFAYLTGIPRSTLYEWDEIRDLMELCTTKKEANLELGALKGELQPTMAIFSLKQLGWTDKVEQNVKSESVVIVDDIK